eukprot:scaffold4_cov247-Pinguiococcus_pyrenoidosus.AAC.12
MEGTCGEPARATAAGWMDTGALLFVDSSTPDCRGGKAAQAAPQSAAWARGSLGTSPRPAMHA